MNLYAAGIRVKKGMLGGSDDCTPRVKSPTFCGKLERGEEGVHTHLATSLTDLIPMERKWGGEGKHTVFQR